MELFPGANVFWNADNKNSFEAVIHGYNLILLDNPIPSFTAVVIQVN